MKKRLIFLFLCTFPIFTALAQETTMQILDRAYMDALKKQHKQAIAKVAPLLDSYALSNVDEIVLAHQILAYSYCELGNKQNAIEHVKALRAFSPNEDFRVFNPSVACNDILGAKPKVDLKSGSPKKSK